MDYRSQYSPNKSHTVDKRLLRTVSSGAYSEGLMIRPHPLRAFEAHREVFTSIQKKMTEEKEDTGEFFRYNFQQVSILTKISP